jgi:serine/threonine protein kinase
MEEITALGLEVRRMLGSGSFAQVYHCYDHTEQCDYAVKVPLPTCRSSSNKP